jgi:hypothetical protein
MSEDKKREPLNEDELEGANGEELPDREVMSVISPLPDRPVPGDMPVDYPISPDDTYPAPLE